MQSLPIAPGVRFCVVLQPQRASRNNRPSKKEEQPNKRSRKSFVKKAVEQAGAVVHAEDLQGIISIIQEGKGFVKQNFMLLRPAYPVWPAIS